MSGGSYDYLCWVLDLGELAAKEHQLEEMADRLAGLGYAQDAARETQELLVQLRQFKVRADVRVKRLSDVWHAVEWWDSSDTAEQGVREALAKYRGEPAAECQHQNPKRLGARPGDLALICACGAEVFPGLRTTPNNSPTSDNVTDNPKEQQG